MSERVYTLEEKGKSRMVEVMTRFRPMRIHSDYADMSKSEARGAYREIADPETDGAK
jgi:hypothetical protein